MEGLVIPGILPPELQQLDATALVQATDIPDMDCLDALLSQVPDPNEIQVEPDSCTNEPESHGGEEETSAASRRFARDLCANQHQEIHHVGSERVEGLKLESQSCFPVRSAASFVSVLYLGIEPVALQIYP